MASNWMNECDDDFNDSERRWAKKVLKVSAECTYGGYVYDYDDRQKARKILGK